MLVFHRDVMCFVWENYLCFVCLAYNSHERSQHSYQLSIDLLNRLDLQLKDLNTCKLNQPIWILLYVEFFLSIFFWWEKRKYNLTHFCCIFGFKTIMEQRKSLCIFVCIDEVLNKLILSSLTWLLAELKAVCCQSNQFCSWKESLLYYTSLNCFLDIRAQLWRQPVFLFSTNLFSSTNLFWPLAVDLPNFSNGKKLILFEQANWNNEAIIFVLSTNIFNCWANSSTWKMWKMWKTLWE